MQTTGAVYMHAVLYLAKPKIGAYVTLLSISTASLLLFFIFPEHWLSCPLITVMRALYTAALVSVGPGEHVRSFYHPMIERVAADIDGTLRM